MNVRPPVLPNAPSAYDPRVFDSLLNELRLYFERVRAYDPATSTTVPDTLLGADNTVTPGGDVGAYAGEGSTGGNAIVEGGEGLSGDGGYISLTGGLGAAAGGAVTVSGGAGSAGDGGAAIVQGGNSLGGDGNGGQILLQAGDGDGTGSGGELLLLAGNGGAGGAGALLSAAAGNAGTGSGLDGGSVEIAAGDADGAGVGGDVRLAPGDGTPAGNVVLNNSGAALATNAQGGFTMLPTCAGTPTGVPGTVPVGCAPIVVDTSGELIWVYIGGAWKSATLA